MFDRIDARVSSEHPHHGPHRVAAYSASGQSAAVASSSQSSSLSLSVVGELNAEELQDIRKGLQFFGRAGRDGQIDEREVSTFLNRQDIDSLASVTGSVQTSRTAAVVSAHASRTPPVVDGPQRP